MDFNIVDLVKDQISDQLVGQLAGAAGTDSTQASNALGGAVPGLLSGLTGAANKPGGAGALLEAVNKQDDGLLGNLGSMLGQGQGNQLAQQGSGILSSLLGGGALGTLSSVIGGMAGIGRGNSSSLLGILAPIVLGVIKKKVLGGRLDAGGLSSMLSSQQTNINAAMPMGLNDQLTTQGFFDSIAGGATGASAPDVSAPRVSAPNVSAPHVSAPEAPKGGGGLFKWLIPAVAVAALAFFGLKFLGGKDVDVPDVGAVGDVASNAADTATDAAGSAADAATDAAGSAASAVTDAASDVTESATAAFSSVTDGIDPGALEAAQAALPAGIDMEAITGQLNGAFSSTTDALGSITDEASATAALPALTEAGEGVSKFGDVFKRLPDAAKGPLSGMVENGMGAVTPLLEKVQAIPGVGGIIEPVIGPMLETLQGLAG